MSDGVTGSEGGGGKLISVGVEVAIFAMVGVLLSCMGLGLSQQSELGAAKQVPPISG